MNTSETPSLEEFEGPYNVSIIISQNQHDEGGPRNYDTEKVELLESDFEAVVTLTEESLKKYLERAGFEKNLTYVWDDFNLDRTIIIEVLDLSLLTPKFLAYLVCR